MKTIYCLLGIFLLGGLTAGAGEKEKLAEDILVLDGIKANIEKFPENEARNNTISIVRYLKGKEIPQAELADLQRQTALIAGKYFNWESVKNDYIKLYCDTYSEEELKAILAFMKSPVGVKMLAHKNEFTAKNYLVLRSRHQKASMEIVKLCRPFVDKIKKGDSPAVKAADVTPDTGKTADSQTIKLIPVKK